MAKHSILDRLIQKPVNVVLSDEQIAALIPGMMVVYKDDEWKTQSGEYLGYDAWYGKKWTFVKSYSEADIKKASDNQTKADKLFVSFKKQFAEAFPTSLPLSSRIHHLGNQIYFYFYAENRYNFSDFVRWFREEVRMKFFLYQVSSRDRVRMHPNRDEWFDPSGLPLMYSIFKHPLPNVDSDAIAVQWLAWRDPESLKDRSWKFDHTLNFEHQRYTQEAKRFPRRWQQIDRYGETMRCMGSNMLTQEIKLRWKGDDDRERFTWERKVVSLKEYQTCVQSTKTPVTETVHKRRVRTVKTPKTQPTDV